MSQPAIVLHDVVKRSGKVMVLDGVSASIEAGRLVGVVGPHGCGKTTLLRLVAGMLRPDSGTIEVLGHDTLRDAAAIQAMIGYIPQLSALYNNLTIAENLELYSELRNVTDGIRQERMTELLDRCGLAHLSDRRVRDLSRTMKQKLALACALIALPRLLLLDEAGAALDPLSRRQLFDFVQSLTIRGMTVLWSTTRFDEAERCAHVLLLDGGRIVADGSPSALHARLAGRTHAILASGAERREVAVRLRAMPGVVDVESQSTMARFSTDAPESEAQLQRFAHIGPSQTVPPRLEDSFIALTAGSRAPTRVTRYRRPPPQVTGHAIEVRRLVRHFGGVVAVAGIDFSVASGEIFGLIGPNGAGKTTILRMLCGLLTPTAGEARIAGLDLRTALPGSRGLVGYMSQGSSLHDELSVAQNLRFLAGIYKLERSGRRARVDDLLSDFGLRAYSDVRLADVPTGARKRAELAASLVHEPPVLLLDEPTAGVDPLTRREIWGHIDALAADGVAVLIATQSVDEAQYCDRVVLAYLGHGIASGRPDELEAAFATHADGKPRLEEAFVALIERCEQRRAA